MSDPSLRRARVVAGVATTALVASLGANVVLGAVAVRLLDPARLELRERQLANHQAVLAAIAATGRVRADDLQPHLRPLLVFEPSSYQGQRSWVVADDGRRLDSTDYPEVELAFDPSGTLLWVGAHKP